MNANDRAHPHPHAVQFYGDSASLCRRVASFLTAGLASGEPAIVIAAGEHRDGIVNELDARLIDVAHARRVGELVLLDAEETLGALMIGGTPDPYLFHSYMGTIFDQVAKGRPRTGIRAYGEMVDLLWKTGQAEAAIKLEILWNALATKFAFSLLCGYSMGQFYKQPDLYRQVCEQHTAVFDVDSDLLSPTITTA
ncbi:MAG TPA: MEDS domain-containing protein [Vicinamibacterales bacterium]|nr:MEDS domain-containing protein [Vicinamibacterales bacterium]